MTVPQVETTYVAGDRFYVLGSDREKVPGMSAILSMMPKPAIAPWMAKEAAKFCVGNLSTIKALAATDEAAAIDLVKSASRRYSNKAADKGTNVHALVEQLMRDRMAGRKSTFSVTPEELRYLKNFARFQREFQAEPVALETTVWSKKHDYAGTFDGIYNVTMPDVPAVKLAGYEPKARYTLMVDTKSGASGVWPEAALQQTGYVHADVYVHPETGELKPMFKVDGAAALWLRPDGWALIPLDTDEENKRQVIRLRESFEWKRSREKYAVGKAINAEPLTRKWRGGR